VYSYGSGHFGRWLKDEFGLPAYDYTCNQLSDEKARTPMNEMWRSNRDHYFLVGNDRIVGIASNFGYVKLRQDEGGPKYLNYYEPSLNQFAGGIGYLKDQSSELTTYFTGDQQEFKRRFGMGYYAKEVADERYHVKQVIFAPFGDDPILISKVNITNKSSEEVEANWFEYWGCFNYQFSFQGALKAIRTERFDVAKEYRIDLEKSYKNKTVILDGKKGFFNMKYDDSSAFKEKQVNFDLRSKGIQITKERADFDDKKPLPIFLISLDQSSDDFFNNASTFFGVGGIKSPDGLTKKLQFEDDLTDQRTCLILKRTVKLAPLESKTIAFAYGYIPVGFDLYQLIEKYSSDTEALFVSSLKQWAEQRIHFEIPNADWIDRETSWHYYYLRGLLTYDSYFQEHILSQGHVYQHIFGFQGAARDPLQHALPFLFTNPDFVKEIIRYTLKEVQDDGEIPYGITGNGIIMPWIWEPSDLELWLLWLVSEYVLSSRDVMFLEQPIQMYPVHGRKAKESTIKELLYLLYYHFSNTTGKGKHGLIRVRSCDWNDLVVTGFVPREQQAEVKEIGESTLNTAMSIHVLSRFVVMLSFAKLDEKLEEIQKFRETLIEPLRKQWNGKWFKRAWLSEALGWVGNEILWLEPQPWAIISEVATKTQKIQLIEHINKLTREPSPIGAMLLSKPIESKPIESKPRKGIGVNGGIWPSINGTLIWALSCVNGGLAFEEWTKNTLARKAEIYPNIWYGIWSGPDNWNSIFSEYPGHTGFDKYLITGKEEDHQERYGGVNWTDFPVLNLHPHAWPLYNIFHLIGTVFTKQGIEFTPVLTKQIYKIQSPLISFEKGVNFYKGHYLPQIEEDYIVRLKLDQTTVESIKEVRVNDLPSDYEVKGNAVSFHGKGGDNMALTWKILISDQ
jgi:hypothetical protein